LILLDKPIILDEGVPIFLEESAVVVCSDLFVDSLIPSECLSTFPYADEIWASFFTERRGADLSEIIC